MSIQDECRTLLAKPIEDIRQDIFFRADNFREEPWYGQFRIFLAIGVCQVPQEEALPVRKRLKQRTGRSDRPHPDRSTGGSNGGRKTVAGTEAFCCKFILGGLLHEYSNTTSRQRDKRIQKHENLWRK